MSRYLEEVPSVTDVGFPLHFFMCRGYSHFYSSYTTIHIYNLEVSDKGNKESQCQTKTVLYLCSRSPIVMEGPRPGHETDHSSQTLWDSNALLQAPV